MSSSAATSDEDHDVDKIVDLVWHVVDVQRDLGQRISVSFLDRIYDRCRIALHWIAAKVAQPTCSKS